MHNNTIESQGRLADARLAAQRLILTQGGEPTCVPCNPVAPEWNIAALGPEKLLYARRLARRLTDGLFQGAVVLHSIGKQYPGEPLPRWQLGLYRSRTGDALWQDSSRLRLDQSEVPPPPAHVPKRFIKRLARTLKLRDTTLPAYEDFESRLRAQDDDAASRLLPHFSRSRRTFVSKPMSRAAMAQWAGCFNPAGWVLPLNHSGRKWRTDKWNFGPGKDLRLLFGDGPIGLRLPLSRLPKGALRRALTVEIKDGELLVFLPPLPTFAAFSNLVKTIEALAVELQLPHLRLEGYPPPNEDDLDAICLTSDPGVIEVNLPPADNWPELERVIRGLFQAIEASGLRSYKYGQHGQRVSTGGGAHILLGGPDLTRNPFVQRPTLLSSFLRFLQNHPSLSYAFSGSFTGPSCQSPRVDESVCELPYELEITLRALEQMPQPGDPDTIDAMLRNLLLDWNGNTHRAELSVDKFFNRNAPNGQLGLVEFRAFEMAPTVEMLLAPNALLRALAACFAEQPYTHPLVDWRERLHDRFALPSCLRLDLHEVLAFLNERGFSFQPEWFEPQFEFRFPIITRFRTGTVEWALRNALEPWPVMGEHSGTGRIVDASTDRLEFLGVGLSKRSQWAVTVNGIHLPLVSIGRGAAVGAVRYRQFDNPWGLQPQVNTHSPLHFEIVDLNTKRVAHAFDYLSWKREGVNFENLPASDEEASQRVAERIVVCEPGRRHKAKFREAAAASSAAPFTLDLRRW